MPHVAPVLEGRTFFCLHCGAFYSVTRSQFAKSESNTAKLCSLLKGHGQVGNDRGTHLPFTDLRWLTVFGMWSRVAVIMRMVAVAEPKECDTVWSSINHAMIFLSGDHSC